MTARANLAEAGHAAILARVDLARAAGRLGPDWLRSNVLDVSQVETNP